MPYLNMSDPELKAKVRALHENLDHALSCSRKLQHPTEDEHGREMEFRGEMFEAVELILEALYGDCFSFDEVGFMSED